MGESKDLGDSNNAPVLSRRTIREALGATIALSLIAHPIQAQDPMPLTRLTGPIVLDGLSNEAAWQAVTPFPLTRSSATRY